MSEPATRDTTSAVILAGGRGRRLGGRDKGLVELAGRPLIEHVLARVGPQVTAVAISANRHLDHYRSLGVPVLGDPLPGYPGPLAGVLAGLRACRTPWLLVVPVDTPYLPSDLLSRLAAAADGADADAALVQIDGRAYPTCALLRRELAGSLAAFLASGERRARDWYHSLPAVLVDLSDQAAAFHNINTAEELAALEAAAFHRREDDPR